MKFSYRWLREFLGDDGMTLEQTCDLLTRGGVEVEEVIDIGFPSGKVVAGHVQAVEPHPNADKLRLATVATGPGEGAPTQKVVCGAPNLEQGKLYPLALLGARLFNGMEIKPAKIRGVESCGMLCSASEIGWGADGSGILELPQDQYQPGDPVDAIIDVKITPDRADCLSIFGIARDAAGLLGRGIALPEPQFEESGEPASASASVEVQDPEGCPRYMARVVRGVKVGPAPLWMRRKLESCGVRPINNIVDVTNYVLLETGHPLHGFDLERLAGSKIVVRRANGKERLRLLDDTEIDMDGRDLVIADAERAHVLAGVMGGEESEVRDETRNVLIECACFEPTTIRRSSKRHNKASESSYRFERGVCYHDMRHAIDRAAQLMADLAGGTVAPGVIDAAAKAPESPAIKLRLDRCRTFLGLDIERSKVEEALKALSFQVADGGGDGSLLVAPPAFRLDVAMEADVLEEVARFVGYEAIPSTLPSLDVTEIPEAPLVAWIRRARHSLAGMGFCEAVTIAFANPDTDEAFAASDAEKKWLEIANPISPEQSAMRRSLLPGLLASVSLNQRRQEKDVALFEAANVFHPRGDAASDSAGSGKPRADDLVRQEARVSAAWCGSAGFDWRSSGKERPVDFYDIKGVGEALLADLNVPATFEADAETPWLHPGRAGRWVDSKGNVLLRAGQLRPELAKPLKLRDGEVYLLDGSVDLLAKAAAGLPTYKALPSHPAAPRDLAFVAEKGVRAGDLAATIEKEGGEFLESARLLDVYEGGQVPEGKRSLAFGLTFRAGGRSLTDEEVNAAVEKIVARASLDHGAELRA